MVTVKQIVALLKEAEEIYLSWDSNVRPYNPDDALDADAYADYLVCRVNNRGRPESYELWIAASPIRKEK